MLESTPVRATSTVAVGPELPGIGSWEWIGGDLVEALSPSFEVVTFGKKIPACDLLLIVKYDARAISDGTPEYLQSLPDVTLIRNADNRGFPAAVNQGIEVARGKNVLLINNDTLVTTGWLRRMLDALNRDSWIALVGPLSNDVSGPLQIPVNYDELSQLDGFAWELGKRHRGALADVERLEEPHFAMSTNSQNLGSGHSPRRRSVHRLREFDGVYRERRCSEPDDT